MPARTENGGNRWRVGVQAKEVKCLESQPPRLHKIPLVAV